MAILMEHMVIWDYLWPSIYSKTLYFAFIYIFFTHDLKYIICTQTLTMIADLFGFIRKTHV